MSSVPPRRRSYRRRSQVRSRSHNATRRSQVQHALRDFHRLPRSSQRRCEFGALLRIDRGVRASSSGNLAPNRRIDDAGMHGVDADAVAKGRAFHRHRLGEQADAPLGRAIAGQARRAAQAASDDIMMTEPPPVLRIKGRPYFTDRKTPSRLIAVCRRQSASVMSTIDGVPMPMPALETNMSSRPKRLSMSPTTSAQRASLVTSCGRKIALRPALLMRVTRQVPSTRRYQSRRPSPPPAPAIRRSPRRCPMPHR
jgi:hypothetical protein